MRGQARHPCPTRQGQRQGFHLVIGMLGQGNAGRGCAKALRACYHQGAVTVVARSLFRALSRAGPRIHMRYRQRHLQCSAAGAAMRCKPIGRRLQAMVHMDGHNLPGQRCAQACNKAVESAPPL